MSLQTTGSKPLRDGYRCRQLQARSRKVNTLLSKLLVLKLKAFFCNIDSNDLWLNVLVSSFFFLLSILVAIKVIPYFTIKELRKKNKKYIVRKISSVIQEVCEYLNYLPFKDKVLNQDQLSIFTTKKDLENHRFVGLININVFNPVSFPKINLVIIDHFEKLDIKNSFELLKTERQRLEAFRLKLESIIDVHSLHIDDTTLSEISDLCLEIRSFDIRFKYNYTIDDLFESGKAERKGVFGVLEYAAINVRILHLLENFLKDKSFEYEINKNQR